jgi:hypothetical protein
MPSLRELPQQPAAPAVGTRRRPPTIIARMTSRESAGVVGFLKRLLVVMLLSLVTLTIVAYTVDFAIFRYRVGANNAFGQVTVTSYDAVQQKNGKTEFLFDPPQAQTCVNSLFPRAGYPPCWYLQRHPERRTDI